MKFAASTARTSA